MTGTPGLGDTPFVEVVPRQDHPHGLRVKNGGYRKIYVSDELDRLYGEYLWRLCDAGADVAVGDLDGWWVFVNLARGPRFAPLRAETVAWQVRRLRRVLEGRVPAKFTPHWLRHTHATALLLSGVAEHVVSRRLGHMDIQTTQNLYGWVSEDAEQCTVAQWQQIDRGVEDAVSRVASAALVASLDGSGLYTPDRNLEIFQQVPRGVAADGVLVAHVARPPGVSLAAGGSSDVARL